MLANHGTYASSLHHLHSRFQAILPRITTHGNIYFRHLRPTHREEAVTEMVALSWAWYRRLVERGKDPDPFPITLASFAARAVRSGRRLSGPNNAKDVLNSHAQQRHGFRVESLPTSTVRSHDQLYATGRGQHHLDQYEERLKDNRQTPIPDQVSFRIDFPTWLTTRTERDRRMIGDMALDHHTADLARRYGMSPARISQLRREYYRDWHFFLGDLPADQEVPATVSA